MCIGLGDKPYFHSAIKDISHSSTNTPSPSLFCFHLSTIGLFVLPHIMKPFKFDLPHQTTLSGIHNIPTHSATDENRPLIVALHGATYDCHYYDADATYTAALPSITFGVPFVSIHRPGYGKTGSLPIPECSSFQQETGSWLHQYALPSLWTKFGLPNGCNCVVLLCHSLGAMGGIIAAAMHGHDENTLYPLGGVVSSGLGDELLPSMRESPVKEPNIPPDRYSFPLDVKDALMFRPGTVDPEILKLSAQLDSPTPFAELVGWRASWIPSWKEDWAVHVRAPVMLALAEQDCFFVGTRQQVEVCAGAFTKSERVDGSLIEKAPHCLELSYWSRGWYARCFGFALECSTSFALE